jgi:molecular chaperone Hsp33
MQDNDTLQRFLFENAPVRGEVVHLDATWTALLERHDYPAPVQGLLGEMMAACALLAATIKFQGAITMQVQSEGPVTLMVVECTGERTLRGMAHWEGEVPAENIAAQFGEGRLVITIDPGEGGERYQGIVELRGERLADALDGYLERSEQLSTRLWLAADDNRAAGMLLQKLPDRETPDADAWDRFLTLGATLTEKELLSLPSREVVHRLFHEEDLRLFEPQALSFRCSCSRQRVADTLRGLGREEVMDILEEQGSVLVQCEFCNQRYEFDAVDAEQIFAEGVQPEVKPTRH